MGKPPLQFWFEFASTYSYPAAMRIERQAHASGVAIAWEPFLLGPIFAEQGWKDSPFNIYPAKGRYMWRDLERLCAREGLLFRRPAIFPQNSLLAARVACVAKAEAWLPEYVRAVYTANFADGADIAQPDAVAACLKRAGQAPTSWLERAQAAENRPLLRRQTERAVALGIFGAPSFVSGTELFWGNDRLEDALVWHRSHA
jgi:2-hydroxychromene-2-carboxylate isomerase